MKSIAIVLLIAMCVPATAFALCGDVTGDGKITRKDVRKLNKVRKGLIGENRLTCDCEDDGSSDCTLRYSQGRLFNGFDCTSSSQRAATLELSNGQTFTASRPGGYSDYKEVKKSKLQWARYRQCGVSIFFDGPFTVPPERKLAAGVVIVDPDVYDFDFFLYLVDEGPRTGAPPIGGLDTGRSELWIGGFVEGGDPARLR